MDYVTQTGATVPDARAESDTARPLADPPGLGLLRESPRASSEPGADQRREIEDWMPWLFMLALLVMLAERAIGLVWLPRRRGDV